MTGRIDSEIAERVMGWRLDEMSQWIGSEAACERLTSYPGRCFADCNAGVPAWEPSTDIACAWMVVEKILPLIGGDIHIEKCENGGWSVSTCHDGGEWMDFIEAETVSKAICLAALEAVRHA